MTGKSRLGFTLIELLISMALLFGVGLGAVSYALWNFEDKSNNYSEEEIMRADAGLTSESLMRQVFNAAYLRPHEGLDTATDAAYNGVSGINGSDPAFSDHLGLCQYQGPFNNESHSILRYTSINSVLSPEKTLGPWREADVAAQSSAHYLNITLHTTGPLNYLFFNGTNNTSEILIIDGDGAFVRRYKVLSVVKKINTNVDPYNNTAVPGKSFDYLQLELEMPKTFTGNVQPPSNSSFVTDSVVYAAQTRSLCMGSDGNIIARDEVNDTYQPILNTSSAPYLVGRFSFEFANLRPDLNLANLAWFSFGAFDTQWRSCHNVARISLELDSKIKKTAPVRLERVFYMNSSQTSRPSYCDTYVPPSCPAGSC